MKLKVWYENEEVSRLKKGTEKSSGMDVSAYLPEGKVVVKTKSVMTIPTGIKMIIPEGHEIVVRPRSGLASKFNVACHLGTIDEDYIGEIKVILANYGDSDFEVENGMRIAQLVLQEKAKFGIEEIDSIDIETDRGANGFGSTGV